MRSKSTCCQFNCSGLSKTPFKSQGAWQRTFFSSCGTAFPWPLGPTDDPFPAGDRSSSSRIIMNPKFHVMILIFHRPSVEIILDKGTNPHQSCVWAHCRFQRRNQRNRIVHHWPSSHTSPTRCTADCDSLGGRNLSLAQALSVFILNCRLLRWAYSDSLFERGQTTKTRIEIQIGALIPESKKQRDMKTSSSHASSVSNKHVTIIIILNHGTQAASPPKASQTHISPFWILGRSPECQPQSFKRVSFQLGNKDAG